MNNPNKKLPEKKLEKRGGIIVWNYPILFIEFNVYVSGANAERVNSQLKKQKHESIQSRSQSRDSRKQWNNAKKSDIVLSLNLSI